MALADIDGDGDLDAYVGNREPDKLWLNDGFGQFTDSGQDLSGGPNTSGAVSLGDIDSDGDLDAIVGKLGGPNEIWRNVGLLVGDFNSDGQVDDVDIDLLAAAIRTGDNTPRFDLNGSGEVDRDDHSFMIEQVIKTFPGDADLDRRVQFPDFVQLAAHYGQEGGWADGDFDGDGQVSFEDFVLLAAGFGSEFEN